MTRHGSDLRIKIQTIKLVSIVLLEWILATHATAVDENHREAMFYRVESASLIGKVTMTRLVKDELECAYMCFGQHLHNCLSFNFGGGTSFDETYVCELSNSERAMEPHRMQKRKKFDYFGLHEVVSKYLFFRWGRTLYQSNIGNSDSLFSGIKSNFSYKSFYQGLYKVIHTPAPPPPKKNIREVRPSV